MLYGFTLTDAEHALKIAVKLSNLNIECPIQ